MIWYLVLGYLAACYLFGLYLLARLATGRRLAQLLSGAGFAKRVTRRPRPLVLVGGGADGQPLASTDPQAFRRAEAA